MPTETQSQIQELEAKIQQLRVQQVQEIQNQLVEARKTVSDLEAEIASITGKEVPSVKPGKATRRTRLKPEDVRNAVMKALAAAPRGLSQKEIAEAVGVSYQTVVAFLRNNTKEFKTTGQMRARRFFLK